ncbi:MAG: CoA ester lyase [Candidatus Rokubacteria bacterium]|nr:CoA ester lyase [Candidatus Rokubacteria bacterium]
MSHLRRSLHFVPGGNERMMTKALTLPADGLILDLEDAVTVEKKAEARGVVLRWLQSLDFGPRERWIRMNPLASGFGEADLEGTIAGRPDGYVVPKPRTAADIRAIAQILDRLEEKHGLPFGSTKLVLIATETPEGLLNIAEVARASPRIAAVSWGIEDLSAAMSLPRTRDADGRYLDIPRHARVMTALAGSAAGVEALDTVFTDIQNLDGLRRECQEAVWMGFTGKVSIHPSQIPVINEVFTPSKEEGAEAQELIAAFEEHARKGSGAFAFKGQMVDVPHLTRARKMLERARLAGVL